MSDDETTPEMLARLGTDAMLWAQEFNKTAVKLGYSEMDEGWLIGWFANAIENSDVIRCNQLRAELAAERDRNGIITQAAQEVTNALRAENEKLREALKPLAAITLWTDKYPDGPLSVGDNQRYIDPQWIVRARAAIECVTEPASPWRDIESAPKDGTWIFIYKDSWHGAIKAKWDTIDGVDRPFMAWVFQDEFLCIGCAEGCLGYNEDIEDGYMPTHWMPLPEPSK